MSFWQWMSNIQILAYTIYSAEINHDIQSDT
jgi:hypothetical protein